MFVAWGPDLRFLYNDAYAVILGPSIRPRSAEPFQHVWAEIWTDLVPIIDRALSNKSAFSKTCRSPMERQGFPSRPISPSRIRRCTTAGRVAGMYCTVIETTGPGPGRTPRRLRADAGRRAASAGVKRRGDGHGQRPAGRGTGPGARLYGEVDDAGRTFTVRATGTPAAPPAVAATRFPIDGFGPTWRARARRAKSSSSTTSHRSARIDCRAYLRAEGMGRRAAVPLMRSGPPAGLPQR
jgi:hypothetical protein